MLHKGCGGKIFEDKTKKYEHNVDGRTQEHYALRCEKCHKEILGDIEIYIPGYDDVDSNGESIKIYKKDRLKKNSFDFGKPIVNIDLECTASERELGSICEIGAVLLDKESLEIKAEFSYLVRPYKKYFEQKAMETHKISLEDLWKAPHIEEVLDSFQLWIVKYTCKNERSVCLSSWGAYFDIPYLIEAYNFLQREYPFDYKNIDIKGIARWEMAFIHPFSRGGTRKISNFLGIPIEEPAHRALPDARQGAHILKELKRRRLQYKK